MTFSILQSIYYRDNPDFLNQSLKSISDNSIQPESIILIKDGSLTSELDSIIAEWKKKLPLKVVSYEKNQGLAHALNYGLQFVETPLVARMDSDDICFLDRFDKQLKFFEEHPDVEILGTGLSEFYVDKNGSELKKNRFYPEYVDCKTKSLFKGTPLGHPTVMMKTELLKRYMYSENTNMNEDIDLWFRLLKAGHVIHNIQEPLLNFRITDGTFKRRSIKKAFSEFQIYWRNLIKLFGFSPLLIYPLARLFVRFLPYTINKKLYFSNARRALFGKKIK